MRDRQRGQVFLIFIKLLVFAAVFGVLNFLDNVTGQNGKTFIRLAGAWLHDSVGVMRAVDWAATVLNAFILLVLGAVFLIFGFFEKRNR